MRRLILLIVALTVALPASSQFDFRTTGTRSARVLEVTCTPTAAPAVSAANMGKIFVPCAGIVGYNAGNIYISQNTGPWTLLSSFVGSGAVTSVFSRTGAITALQADYDSFFTTPAEVTTALSPYAPLASPTFTGTPAAPTAVAGTSTTQMATTAFVTTADNLKANLASPALSGTPTAPTAIAATNTTQIATTAHVFAERANTATLTSKTIALGSNTVSGTAAQFNTALTDGDFATLTGAETLTSKTLTSPVMTTPALGVASATSIQTSGAIGIAAAPTARPLTFAQATGEKIALFTGSAAARDYYGLGVESGYLAYQAPLNAGHIWYSNATERMRIDATSGSVVMAGSPTISSFTNANHTHVSAAQGGQITTAALSDYATGSVAYSAGNFTASTGTWTVDSTDQATFAYTKNGNELTVWFSINSTDVSATPNYLIITIPGGYTAAIDSRGLYAYSNAGGAMAFGVYTTNATQLRLYRDPFSVPAWSTTATDNTSVQGVAHIRVN